MLFTTNSTAHLPPSKISKTVSIFTFKKAFLLSEKRQLLNVLKNPKNLVAFYGKFDIPYCLKISRSVQGASSGSVFIDWGDRQMEVIFLDDDHSGNGPRLVRGFQC